MHHNAGSSIRHSGERKHSLPRKRPERPRFGAMFYVWFVSMLIVFTIPLIVSYYVQDRADRLIKEELISTEASLIKTMRMVSDREILSISQYAAGIAENRDVRAFLSSPSIQTADERLLVKQAFEDIRSQLNRPECITDLFLLSLRNSYIISARMGSNAEGSPIFDYEHHFGCSRDALREKIRSCHSSLLFLPGAGTEETQSIFYLRVVTEKSSAYPLGYVLISYSFPDSILSTDEKSFCGLVSENGQVWDMTAERFLPEEESSALFSTEPSGFTRFRSAEYLVSRQRSTVLGLDYLRAVRTDQLFGRLLGYQRFYRICLICCTLLCIALSLILSRQNYHPVLQLVENLKQTENRKTIGDVNFQWIEERYHGLLESHTKLSSQLEQEKNLIVNNLFCRLLKGYYHSAYEIENVFGPHLIEFREPCFRLILWSPDDDLYQMEAPALPTEMNSVDLIHYLIASLAREQMEKISGAVWSVDCEGMVFVLCNFRPGDGCEEADFTGKNREAQAILKDRLGIQLSWFMSGEYTLPTEIPLAYMECIEKMRQTDMPDPQDDAPESRAEEEVRDSGNLAESVMNYVSEHLYDQDLSLTKIGNSFNLTESYLSRLIRKTYDIQLMTFVNAKRIERVAYLLEHTDRTLNEIALDAGFSTYRTMIRVFEQYHLMTPSQYRKEKRAAGK